MPFQIICPAMFEGTHISADVIFMICVNLKLANIDIEELILDEIVPEREGIDSSVILNEVAMHFSTKNSFDDLISLKKNKLNFISSVSFLLTGNSSKKDITETTADMTFWELDNESMFRSICIAFHILLEIFLSDHSHFSYDEFYFDRGVELLSKLEIDAIYEVDNSFSETNPMIDSTKDLKSAILSLAAKNDQLAIKSDQQAAKSDAKFDQMMELKKQSDAKFDQMMDLILSLKTELSIVKEKTSIRKEPKRTTQILHSKPSARIDKGNPFSPLVNLNTDVFEDAADDDNDDDDDDNAKSSQNDSFINDEIEEYTDDDSDAISMSKSYTTPEMSFIKDQTNLWKSNVLISNPREIHILSSLASNKGLLIAQASGQLVLLKTLKTSVKTPLSYDLLTLGTKFIDCQTNILFPRSYPEMISYFSDTINTLQKIVGGQIDCNPEVLDWATRMSQHIHAYHSKLHQLFKHAYKAQYAITQYAILLRVHIWCMNVAVISKDPSFLKNVNEIWDKYIKHVFEATPSGENLISACTLLGYRCVTCYKMYVPTQLCSTCLPTQTIAKAGPFTSKTQLEKDHFTWTTSPDGIAWLASNAKASSFSHYCSKIATSAQKEAHNKLKRPTNSPKFATHAKCLSYYAINQNEIPLLCSSEHFSK